MHVLLYVDNMRFLLGMFYRLERVPDRYLGDEEVPPPMINVLIRCIWVNSLTEIAILTSLSFAELSVDHDLNLNVENCFQTVKKQL